MALQRFASVRGPRHTVGKTKEKGTSGHQEQHKRRRLQKATPGCYFETRFPLSSQIIGDGSIVGMESCLEPRRRVGVEVGGGRADDDVLTGGGNHKQDCSQDQESAPQPRIGAHPKAQEKVQTTATTETTQPTFNWNFSDDSISIYSTHSFSIPAAAATTTTNKIMESESEVQHRRRSCKTPVFFVGQLERKSVASCCLTLDKAQILADEYQAVLPLRLKTSFVNCYLEEEDEHDHSKSSPSSSSSSSSILSSYLPKTPKRLRKIKCQLSLRDLVKQHELCAPSLSPLTPGSDAETLIGSPLYSPLDGDFEKGSPQHTRRVLPLSSTFARPGHESYSPRPRQSQRHNQDSDSDNDSDSEHSLPTSPNRNPETDIGLKICTELLTHELATALLRRHPSSTSTSTPTDRASGLQILLMIEAYETVQSQVRRMLYDTHVTGKRFGHVRDAERILEHWLQALYAVYDREQEEEGKMMDMERGESMVGHEYEWRVRSELGGGEGGGG
ncbi:hypothetical protein BKA61DRAFT_595676 [Leptodontidium sp. MPI-SDFR-AT-0119]|nr:hypothetical protein BKA61DRAFT_595676 [Leptodontidium sp. MPI-SDFR-AT-0119]